MPNNAVLQSLRQRLPDQFSRDALDGALHVLDQADNKDARAPIRGYLAGIDRARFRCHGRNGRGIALLLVQAGEGC